MSGKIMLQHLKALERAPHGTLAFRSYLLKRYSTILCNKAFGGLEALMGCNKNVSYGTKFIPIFPEFEMDILRVK